MRLFVAVDVGPEVRREAVRVADELKRRLERSAPDARISWVAPDRLHITVRFIGQVSDEVSDSIRQAMDGPLSTPVFNFTIAGTGTFPPGRPPRVFWAGITTGLDQLRTLEREVGARLEPLPLSREDRSYQPHLTLARVKYSRGIHPGRLLDGLGDTRFGTVSVEAVTLCESRLSPKGPTYVPLCRTPLRHA